MKYIIDIPSSQEYSYDKDFKSLDLKFHDDNFSGMTRFDAEPYTEPDRKAVEDEVWNFVDFIIWEMDAEDRYGCFDRKLHSHVFHDYTYQEAKSKYEAWLKQKDEIHVGDEVKYIEDPRKKIVVIRIDSVCFDAIDSDGNLYLARNPSKWVKTGRHFPEVAELLEKMRGEEE